MPTSIWSVNMYKVLRTAQKKSIASQMIPMKPMESMELMAMRRWNKIKKMMSMTHSTSRM